MNDLNDKLLCILASMTVENEYLVVSKKEIIDMTDGGLGVDELDKRVEALEVNDMIVVRYSDGDNYCLAVRPKGRINAEKIRKAEVAAALAEGELLKAPVSEETRAPVAPIDEEDAPETPVKKLPLVSIALVCAGSAFLGGMLAAIVAFLIGKLL